MASLNKVQIIGNLGRDPEARTFPSGDMVCNITVATTEKWKDKQTGEQKEHTEWVRIVFNGKLAEIANQYLRKGSQVYVEGSLRTRKWTDQSGVEKYSTEIRADQMQMLGPRQDGGGRGGDGGGYDDGYGGGQQRQQQRQAPQGQRQRQAPQGGRGNDGYGVPQQRQQGGQQQHQHGQQQNRGGGGGSGFDDFDQDIPFISSSFINDAESKLDRRIRRSNRTRRES